jgi:hypothetical protein
MAGGFFMTDLKQGTLSKELHVDHCPEDWSREFKTHTIVRR